MDTIPGPKDNIEEMLSLISLNTIEYSDKLVPNLSLSSENNSNQNSSYKCELGEIESTPKDLFGVSPIVAINSRYTFSSISSKALDPFQKPGNFFLSPPIHVIEEASESSARHSMLEIKLQDYPEKTPYFEINHENNISWENIKTPERQEKDSQVKANRVKLAPTFEDISAIDKLTPVEENSSFSSFDINFNSSGLLKGPEIVISAAAKVDQAINELPRRNSKILEDYSGNNNEVLKKSAENDSGVNAHMQNSDSPQGYVNNKGKRGLKQKQSTDSQEPKLCSFSPAANGFKGNNSFTSLNNESDIILQKKNILKPVFMKRKKYLTAGPNQNDSFIIHSKPQPRMRFSKSEKKIETNEGKKLSRPPENQKATAHNKSKILVSTIPKLKDVLKKKPKPLERSNPYAIEINQATFQKIFNVNMKIVTKNDTGKINIKKCLRKRKVTVL